MPGVLAWLRRNLGAVLRFCATVLALGWAAHTSFHAWGSTPMPGLAAGPMEWAVAVAVGTVALVLLATVSAAGVVALGLVPRIGIGAFTLAWYRLWFISYLYRYIPGKVVLIAERVRMGRNFGIPATPSVLLVVWESGLLLAGAAVFSAIGYAGVPLPADAPLSQVQVIGGAGLCIVGLLLFPYELRWAARRFPWLAQRLPGMVLDVPMLAQLGLVLGNAVCWGLLGLCFAQTAALFENGMELPVRSLAVWYVVSYVVGQVSSVTPAGLGVREAVLVATLADVAAPPVVLAWAVANRLLLAAVEHVLQLLSLTVRLPSGGAEPEPAG